MMNKTLLAAILLLTAASASWADQGDGKTKKNPILEEAQTRKLHSQKAKPPRKVEGKAKKGAPQVSGLPVKKDK